VNGSCQESIDRLETAFVVASTAYEDFPFEATHHGCLKFCQGLPSYPEQISMAVLARPNLTFSPTHHPSFSPTNQATDHQDSTSNLLQGADICTCVYENGKLPSRELMPAYAIPSLPMFTLTSSTGMALGLRPNINCDSATELTIETQLSDPSNPRQQFEMTYDGRIVSVACPTKVLTTVLALDGLCSAGITLSLSTANFLTSDESLLQQWMIDSEQGIITNAKCPNLAISSIKEKDAHMNSIYFALQNPRTQLAIGVTGTTDDTCTNGMALEMQDMIYGAPNQQFIYDEADQTIS
jgi:hypothetical protein